MRVCLNLSDSLYADAVEYAEKNPAYAGNVSAVIRLAIASFFAHRGTHSGHQKKISASHKKCKAAEAAKAGAK
jgi:hypothetical protein